MPYVDFHDYCPDVAERETRTITVMPNAGLGVPAGQCGFMEMYCDEAGCDCRRVFFTVVSSTRKEIDAVIAWGWEDRAFYARWMGCDDPRITDEMQGPILNLASPRSKNAPALLKLVQNVLLSDPAYVERIKRHYTLFRWVRSRWCARNRGFRRETEGATRVTPRPRCLDLIGVFPSAYGITTFQRQKGKDAICRTLANCCC